ncbi:hypothetical protein FOZ63_023360, partial [Perkinsus olseni]
PHQLETLLRKEILKLQRELVTERTKAKALIEELENPENTHRWRRLTGTDLNSVELEDKISELQRRLIKKCEELVDCDLVLQEKEQHKLQLHKLILLDDSDDVKEGSREDGDRGTWTAVDLAQEATDLQR